MTNSNGDRTQGHRRCYRTSEVTSDIYDAIYNIPAIAGSPKRPPDDDWVYYLLLVVLFISLCMAFLTPLITSKDTDYESQSLLRATENLRRADPEWRHLQGHQGSCAPQG
ncbi:hypothetical protein PSP30_gp25 [Pseudomonas phage PSP30]|nr:hypothetical protein PSP30_gp25 [Pseudomonas phage PSP30]